MKEKENFMLCSLSSLSLQRKSHNGHFWLRIWQQMSLAQHNIQKSLKTFFKLDFVACRIVSCSSLPFPLSPFDEEHWSMVEWLSPNYEQWCRCNIRRILARWNDKNPALGWLFVYFHALVRRGVPSQALGKSLEQSALKMKPNMRHFGWD